YVLLALKRLIRKIPEHSNWNGPQIFLSDFEKGMINAVTEVFPNTQAAGCTFHLGKSLYRKIQQQGLAKIYSRDSTFSLRMRVLIALSYLPESEVRNAFAD